MYLLSNFDMCENGTWLMNYWLDENNQIVKQYISGDIVIWIGRKK